MRTVGVVTGYVPIPNHPRSEADYDRLAAPLLRSIGARLATFRHEIGGCWLRRYVRNPVVPHAVADNPTKNTLDYHVVQHQKSEWIARAAERDSDISTWVWIDYGIFSQPGITIDIINAFLDRVRASERDTIDIPGAWDHAYPPGRPDPLWPDWRFLGSSLVMPRYRAGMFHSAVMTATLDRIMLDNRVSWEVNDWAEVERRNLLPIRWYKADHNHTQFTNYPPLDDGDLRVA